MVSYNSLECLILVIFFLNIRFPSNYAQLENNAQPEVSILEGTLLGISMTTRHDRLITAFLGIPYAQPPTGNRRFANPVAADPWDGILNASTAAHICPQGYGDVVMGDEDCLYLNVYTPQLPQNTNSSLLPVMVWIHGGAFKAGDGSPTTSGPQFLMDKDVVLVAMNYRLGLLGFLSTGDEIASGNWGLKDQVLALEWVQNNIAYFGGDPDQVTLFGESAGAASVHLLSLSDATIGLFHKYITQSGSALGEWAYRPRAAYSSLAFEFGEYCGCSHDSSDSLISCLRALDMTDIVATDSHFSAWKLLPDIVWGPTDELDIEGAILIDSPSNLFAAGKIRDLPWISGVVRDEGLLLSAGLYEDEQSFDDFFENFDTRLPALMGWMYQSDSGAAWVNATKSYYFNNDLTMNRSDLFSNFTTLVSDSHFFYPAYNAIQQQNALAKSPQYFYTFNYRGTSSGRDAYSNSSTNYGVSHADDLLYLFSPYLSISNYSESDYEMVDIMVQLWTSFAIDGTPSALNLDGATTWEPYSTKDNYLRIGNESDIALELQYSFFNERMQFWAALDVIAEEPEAALDGSGSSCVTSSPNLHIVIFLACAKFFLSGTTASTLR